MRRGDHPTLRGQAAAALLALIVAMPAAGGGFTVWPGAPSRQPEAAWPVEREGTAVARVRADGVPPGKRIVLDPVAESRAARISAAEPGAPLRIGFHRAVTGLASAADFRQGLQWMPSGNGGQVAAVAVTSPEAGRIRAGLRVYRLPDQATVHFLGTGTGYAVSGGRINETIGANLAAGDRSERAHIYWSPVLAGAEVTVEIELPAGLGADAVEVALPMVSHVWADALPVPERASERVGEASYCELDATCYQASWASQMNATARMVFSDGSWSYLCTGTLLNDYDDATQLPWFLTARHCISSQTEASSLNTDWFYGSPSCNAGTLGDGVVTLAGGATLLHTDAATDASFLRLNAPPPAGSAFSGWSAQLPSAAAGVTGIHHPQGDLKKISFGLVSDFETCGGVAGSGTYSCAYTPAGGADHIEVRWNSGTTEAGSSGSGLFLTGGKLLVGQLHGGISSCSSGFADDYGAFKVSYDNGIHRWLGSASAPKSLMVSLAGAGSGSVQSSPAGIDCGGDCAMSFGAGVQVVLSATPAAGSDFAGWGGACTGSGTCTVAMDASKTVTANFAPAAVASAGLLGTPAAGATVSGVGVISGYHCSSQDIDVYVDGSHLGKAGAGTTLLGTQAVCGRTNTGYSLLYNFNNLADGEHTVTVHAGGVPFDSHVFTSFRSGGTPWRSGLSRTVVVPDFPQAGRSATLEWLQSYQNFLVTGIDGATPAGAMAAPVQAAANVGVVGTPVAGSTVSGVGVISGYHCTSHNIRVYIDGADIGRAGAGTTLLGTQEVCGHTDTGYSLLYNFNNLSNGPHTVTVYADGILLGSNSFTSVQSGGTPWLSGMSRTVTVADFPQAGQDATLEWVQSYQNFLITGITGQ
jgi:hypothetical protein